MSRGRKAKNNNGKSAVDLFKHFRSNYFYFILKELGKKKVVLTNQTSLELYEKLKDDKSKVNKDKSYSQVESDEIPFEIPSNWNWCRLGELFQIERGSSPRPKGDPMYFSKERTNHHWIKISDISASCKENVLLDTEEFLTDAGTQYGRYVTNKDLIVAVSGSVGKTCLLGINGYIYDGLLSVKNIDNETVRYFLFNLFKHYEKQLLEKATGAIWQNINTDIAKNQLIPLPPIIEQQMILDFLNDFGNDNLKEGKVYFDVEIEGKVKSLFQNQLSGNLISDELAHQRTLVKNLRQQLLQEAVQGKLVKNDVYTEGVLESAHDLLKTIKAEKAQLIKAGKLKKEKDLPPIKAEEIPFEIPENWVWCRFIDVVNIESNLVSPFDYPNFPHIAPDNIEKNTGKLLSYKTVLEDDVQSANHLFYAGQLIYSKVRPQLNKVVKISFEGLCSADMYPLKSWINPTYLQYSMLSQYFLIEVNKFDNRVKMPKINQNQLSQIPFPLPPLAEQTRIVQKLDTLMELCDNLDASIAASAIQNEQLLQQVLREALGG